MDKPPVDICIYSFDELNTRELYDILRLRQDVFVVEQHCAYPDIDGMDGLAKHVLAMKNGALVGYARVFAPGRVYAGYAAIGRILTRLDCRRQKIGRAVMLASIQYIRKEYPGSDIKLAAQTYLLDWYKRFGFKQDGAAFLEDDIPHQHMVLRL